MTDVDAAQRRAAKVAAIATPVAFAIIVYANFGLRGPLIAGTDTAETIRRIGASIGTFRLSAGFDIAYCILTTVAISALYVVLRPVSRLGTLLAVLWKLLYIATAMLTALSLLAVARLVTNEASAQLSPQQLQALVSTTLAGPWMQYYVGLVFWALSSTVIGWLWYKSRYVPRWLAWFGIIASAWCAFCAFVYIIQPAFADTVNLWLFDSPMAIYDLVLSGWLLSKGLPHTAG